MFLGYSLGEQRRRRGTGVLKGRRGSFAQDWIGHMGSRALLYDGSGGLGALCDFGWFAVPRQSISQRVGQTGP